MQHEADEAIPATGASCRHEFTECMRLASPHWQTQYDQGKQQGANS
eukprot:CAMPEP_0175757416 /NCGR_PEP_ID=MMETSP0097-20121207/64451_1 /TAXON_ID=311494 /ORGANISM="Alexandrium monilatum, Strain CCMP3105" /LENGTH=45 /DNA_ID= /DNA_START= /DNA_END= /DNA_ORIENTATION=